MRLFFFLFSCFLFSTAFADAKKLVVLGDSLTEGYGVAKEAAYPALLEQKIHQSGHSEWTVVNAGVSGSSSASAVGRLKWLFKNKPNLLIIALGANDGLRGLKVADTEKSLAEAIEYTQAQKVPVILAGVYMPPNYGMDYTEQFKKMYTDLAKKYKIPLIPFLLDKVAGDPKYNQTDGIHPNEAGHKIIAETLYQALKGRL